MRLEIGEWYSMLVARRTRAYEFLEHTIFFKVSSIEEYYLLNEDECAKVFKIYTSERITINRNYSTDVKMIGYLTDSDSGTIIPHQENIYKYLSIPNKIWDEEVKRKITYAKFGV